MTAYYNEIDLYAAQWLRNLIAKNLIAPGDVDTRPIQEVHADDLRKYTQCHFFAGIGGWSHALRLAGWDDGRPVWTGSCPCQPFSSAGKKAAQSDERHLWPYWSRLIAECRPAVIFGEQVDDAVAAGWLDDVFHDLEAQEYACASAILPACSIGAPHRRDRLWFVANSDLDSNSRTQSGGNAAPDGLPSIDRQENSSSGQSCGTGNGIMADTAKQGLSQRRFAEMGRSGTQSKFERCGTMGITFGEGLEGQPRNGESSGGGATANRSIASTNPYGLRRQRTRTRRAR